MWWLIDFLLVYVIAYSQSRESVVRVTDKYVHAVSSAEKMKHLLFDVFETTHTFCDWVREQVSVLTELIFSHRLWQEGTVLYINKQEEPDFPQKKNSGRIFALGGVQYVLVLVASTTSSQ